GPHLTTSSTSGPSAPTTSLAMFRFQWLALASVFVVSPSLFAQAPAGAAAGAAADAAPDPAAGGRGRGGARGGGGPALNGLVAPMLAQGDSDGDGALSKAEI